jgi:hypothetical protein
MTTSGFFLNHIPEGSMVVYEFHKNRPAENFDYHQIYAWGTPVKSTLFTPKHFDFVSKVQKVREKYTSGPNRLYIEWDNPLGGELKTPAAFIDFGSWWSNPEERAPTESEWNGLLLETAQAAGFHLNLDDIPPCPNTDPFYRVTFGFFPDRDHSSPWFRVVCAKSVAECPNFAEQMGFSTKWFDKFDLNKYCESCLISFNISKEGVTKPAAEMILKTFHQREVPPEFSKFSELHREGKELILKHHGEHLQRLSLCHFKVTLTDESYGEQEAKMYMFGHIKQANG